MIPMQEIFFPKKIAELQRQVPFVHTPTKCDWGESCFQNLAVSNALDIQTDSLRNKPSIFFQLCLVVFPVKKFAQLDL